MTSRVVATASSELPCSRRGERSCYDFRCMQSWGQMCWHSVTCFRELGAQLRAWNIEASCYPVPCGSVSHTCQRFLDDRFCLELRGRGERLSWIGLFKNAQSIVRACVCSADGRGGVKAQGKGRGE
jgi:hypothetical protein